MRMQGRNYNTSAVDRALQGTNASVALEKMLVPEVCIYFEITIF